MENNKTTEGKTEKCESCGKETEEKNEGRVIKETKQCIECLTKKRKLENERAEVCMKCGKEIYPLNAFIDSKGKKWTCGECLTKEKEEEEGIWEQETQAKKPLK